MESNGNAGKPNSGFHYCNGGMGLPTNHHYQQNNYNNNNKPRKFSLPSGNISGGNKIPLDRMSSVASSQYTTANSILKLVNDDKIDGHSKTKTCFVYCKRKWPWLLLYLIVFTIIITLTTLYILEKRSNNLTKVRKTFYTCENVDGALDFLILCMF